MDASASYSRFGAVDIKKMGKEPERNAAICFGLTSAPPLIHTARMRAQVAVDPKI
jgi:hypothetical protein